VFHRQLQKTRRFSFDISHLLYTMYLIPQQQAAVKLLGSSQPTRGPWSLHQEEMFTGSQLETMPTELVHHARHHLNGKELRYLKKVTDTSGLHQSFTPLDQGFRSWQWPRLTSYTSHFWLATRGVFVKQSGRPSHCALPSQPLSHNRRDPFSRSYETNLSISFSWVIPTRLSFLS